MWAYPNDTIKFADVPYLNVPVHRGMTHDGIGKYLSMKVEKAPGPTDDIIKMCIRDRSYFTGMYSNTYPGLDHYWRETSFNQVNIAGSAAYGWFTLPQPRSAYFDNEGNLLHNAVLNDCIGVANSSVYFPTFKMCIRDSAWMGRRDFL